MKHEGVECEHRSHRTFWKILGGTALVLALAGLVANLPDIKRYVRISTM